VIVPISADFLGVALFETLGWLPRLVRGRGGIAKINSRKREPRTPKFRSDGHGVYFVMETNICNLSCDFLPISACA
jgi:hypothetical protein